MRARVGEGATSNSGKFETIGKIAKRPFAHGAVALKVVRLEINCFRVLHIVGEWAIRIKFMSCNDMVTTYAYVTSVFLLSLLNAPLPFYDF